MGSRRDFAIGQQQLADVQADSFAGPEDGVANAIGKINFAGFGGTHQLGVAEIEVGEMAANYIIVRRCSAEIAEIPHASRDHRVGIDAWNMGKKSGGSRGTCGRESKIVADISPGPKRGGQNL